eukprot:6276938-Prymnesium_polylepis.1
MDMDMDVGMGMGMDKDMNMDMDMGSHGATGCAWGVAWGHVVVVTWRHVDTGVTWWSRGGHVGSRLLAEESVALDVAADHTPRLRAAQAHAQDAEGREAACARRKVEELKST